MKAKIREWIASLKQLQYCNLHPQDCRHDEDQDGKCQSFDSASIDMHLGKIIDDMKTELSLEHAKVCRSKWIYRCRTCGYRSKDSTEANLHDTTESFEKAHESIKMLEGYTLEELSAAKEHESKQELL